MIDRVYNALIDIEKKNKDGVSANDISYILDLDRSTISRYLNALFKENKINKIDGRPVLYKSYKNNIIIPYSDELANTTKGLDKLAGAKQSLSIPIEKAKAAIVYPPKGLHTLLLGETGVGKSLFAEQMYEYAKDVNILNKTASFIRFNCADYANNQNLLTAQIFGVKKGTFTGADSDKEGLLKQADNGVLFLDEIHRLSPEGQEMLFTYIDKGFFRALGETEKTTYVNVRIIAATTEDPNSYLLQTFSRRIPMIIRLPNLNERTLGERYFLIELFIREESRRIGKSIYINKNSMISYLLYDCPNNIGQLKSDIQLSCAKAFLNYKSNINNYIIINQGDLPNHVRRGLLYINEYRNEVNELLSSTYDVLRYSEIDEPPLQLTHEEENISEDFYNIIEEKIENLKVSGMGEVDINNILNIDIESHFQKYIGEIGKRYNRDDINNLVDSDVLNLVEEILILAKDVLNVKYDESIYFGLSFHLDRSIQRIKKGEKIFNPKLNFIRVNYEDEFIFAMKIAKLIDNKFNIEIPVDEIGYLAMFFSSEYFRDRKESDVNTKVIVAMHGRSTASSMVEVVNSLIGSEFVVPLDMPLSMKPQQMYEITKTKVKEIHRDRGIILMVDMGSLTNFGHMIIEETGIEIRTVDMVSTLMVLDVARKALLGYTIDEIFDSTISHVMTEESHIKTEKKNNIILAACFTGDGLARRIKELTDNKIKDKNIEIININILGDKKLEDRIIQMQKRYNILAIISAVDIHVESIPLISAVDLLSNRDEITLDNIIIESEMYDKIWESLKDHLKHINSNMVCKDLKDIINSVEHKLKTPITDDVKMGLALHICFMVDRLLSQGETRKFDDLSNFKKQFSKEMTIVHKEFELFKKNYQIYLDDNEIAYIVKLFIENSLCVQ